MPVGDVVGWLRDVARVIVGAPAASIRWMRANASRCVAVTWLAGMTAFGVVTVRRAVTVHAAEEAAEAERLARAPARPGNGDGPGETVAMMDVEEMEQLHKNRMHANGLAAAGESDDPDSATIAAAKDKLAEGVGAEGEVITTRGGVTVVSKGGIQGWLKRNRGRKADPEMLAWIRAEEAAEGRAGYAGWADREDGNILEWHKSNVARGAGTHAGAAGSGDEANAADEAIAAEGLPVRGAPEGETETAAETLGPTVAGREAGGSPTSVSPTAPDAATEAVTLAAGSATAAGSSSPIPSETPTAVTSPGAGPTETDAARPTPTATTTAPARRPLPLAMLGDAVRASIAAPPAMTGTGLVASLQAKVPELAELGTATADSGARALLSLLAHRMFGDQGRGTELTPAGIQLVRALVKLLVAEPRYVLRLTTTEERAIEVAAIAVIAGLPTPRLEIVLKPVDLALDVVEIELVAP